MSRWRLDRASLRNEMEKLRSEFFFSPMEETADASSSVTISHGFKSSKGAPPSVACERSIDSSIGPTTSKTWAIKSLSFHSGLTAVPLMATIRAPSVGLISRSSSKPETIKAFPLKSLASDPFSKFVIRGLHESFFFVSIETSSCKRSEVSMPFGGNGNSLNGITLTLILKGRPQGNKSLYSPGLRGDAGCLSGPPGTSHDVLESAKSSEKFDSSPVCQEAVRSCCCKRTAAHPPSVMRDGPLLADCRETASPSATVVPSGSIDDEDS